MLVIAHRGYCGKYPENTLRAFSEALSLGAPALELDVHLSKDFELVVTHDFKLDRCVKSSGLLSEFTAKELTAMDAGSHKGADFKTEGVPLLSTVLDLVGHKALLNIEIKEESLVEDQLHAIMTEKLLASLRTYGLKDILFSSFNAYALKNLRAKSAEARLALLDDLAFKGPRLQEAQDLRAEAYNVNLKRVTFEQVAQIREAGLKVNAYTARNTADLALAKSLEVDGVFADNLEDALRLFNKA